MKLNRITKQERDLIIKFFTEMEAEQFLEDCNFKLMDCVPDKSYYSYYVTCFKDVFNVHIDYEKRVIYVTVGFKPINYMKF